MKCPRRVALVVVSLLVAACHHRAAPEPYGARVTPVAGYCGQRAAVSVSRARAPRMQRAQRLTGPGGLVVQIASADSGLTPPQGPVRVRAAGDGTPSVAAAQTLADGTLRSGPIPAGRYVVEVTGTGYQPRRLPVTVRAGLTDTVRFRLAARCVRRG